MRPAATPRGGVLGRPPSHQIVKDLVDACARLQLPRYRPRQIKKRSIKSGELLSPDSSGDLYVFPISNIMNVWGDHRVQLQTHYIPKCTFSTLILGRNLALDICDQKIGKPEYAEMPTLILSVTDFKTVFFLLPRTKKLPVFQMQITYNVDDLSSKSQRPTTMLSCQRVELSIHMFKNRWRFEDCFKLQSLNQNLVNHWQQLQLKVHVGQRLGTLSR